MKKLHCVQPLRSSPNTCLAHPQPLIPALVQLIHAQLHLLPLLVHHRSIGQHLHLGGSNMKTGAYSIAVEHWLHTQHSACDTISSTIPTAYHP